MTGSQDDSSSLTIRPMPLTEKLLRRHPVEGEELIFNREASLHCTLFTETEELQSGEIVLTSLRIGVVTAAGDSDISYYMAPIEDLRHIGYSGEDNILYLRFVDPAKPERVEQDIYGRVQFDSEQRMDDIWGELYEQRTRLSRPATLEEMDGIGRDIHEGRFDAAILKLDRLLGIEPLNGMLHLMKARTLYVCGRRAEAVTCAAKHIASILYIHAGYLILEYLWYDWHEGALRLLPDPNAAQADGDEREAALLWAVTASARGDKAEFVRQVCKVVRFYMEEGDDVAFTVALRLLSVLSAETREPIRELYRELSERLEGLADEIGPEAVESLIPFFQLAEHETKEEALDSFERLIGRETGTENGLEPIRTMFLEQYEAIRDLASSPQPYTPPEEWTVGAVVTERGLWIESEWSGSMRRQACQIWAEARLTGTDSPAFVNRLNLATQGEWKNKLEAVDNGYLSLLLTLLQVERSIRQGRTTQALVKLADWKKENRRNIGLFENPWLLYGEELIDYYTAWAMKSESDLRDALSRIPNRHPFLGLHRESAGILEELRADARRCAIEGHEMVLGEMKQAVALAESLTASSDLGLRTLADAARSFSHEVKQKLADASLAMHGEPEAATGQASSPKRESFFGRLKAKLFGSGGDGAKEDRLERAATSGTGHSSGWAKANQIRIAIAGESGSGKTTMLNAIFRTNLFFATQEEATGVPTEVTYGKLPRIEVWDREGKVRRHLDIPADWFGQGDGDSLLLSDRLEEARRFITEHTRVGSPELAWVERVAVAWPLEGLPEHAVLVDTPGFNAHTARSALAEAVLRDSNMCLYIMDARHALKGQELETMQFIRHEAGKTFIVLNKMDLVFGDDELDCDGEGAAEETIARVRRELAEQFAVDDVIVFPVCSLPGSGVPQEARRYAANLESLVVAVFQEAKDGQLDYIIDASAKSALHVFREVQSSTQEAAAAGEQELLKLERAVPLDFRLFEEEARELLKDSMNRHRGAFYDAMNKHLEESFGGSLDLFVEWLQTVDSASELKKQVGMKAENLVKATIALLEYERKEELERMGRRVAEDAAAFMKELYRNLPFSAASEPEKLTAGLATLNVSSSGQLATELQSINYGGGINGGAAIGAAIGAVVLGPVGALIGGVLGQLFGGKSLDEVKQEVYEAFRNSISELWDQTAEVLNRDLSPQQTASFLNMLQKEMDGQLDGYRSVVRLEIDRRQAEWRTKLEALLQLQLTARSLQVVMERLRDWRMVRRARLR
ncbi:dynamin family protein [Paenibacillus puerhi]|uniref:dynamin family protein n=1 Tax=Paenibacillus puerhi TaxID=2692622 RepID=UPI00135CA85C|nr:dynamin family protein [Paenibacillus puerhi]